MALIEVKKKIIHCKIVYYGIGMSGKTSSLQYIHEHITTSDRSDILSIATETERSLFFDFFLDTPDLMQDCRVRWHLYTIPGAVLYKSAYTNILKGVDGVVFVIDSRARYLQENWESLQELAQHLASEEQTLANVPLVLQYNKCDLDDRLPVGTLNTYFNLARWPYFETVAGTMDTTVSPTDTIITCFHAIRTQVLAKLGPSSEPELSSIKYTTWQEVAEQFSETAYLGLPNYRETEDWVANTEYEINNKWPYGVLLLFGLVIFLFWCFGGSLVAHLITISP